MIPNIEFILLQQNNLYDIEGLDTLPLTKLKAINLSIICG
jgi:hypothetical protein